MSLNKVGTFFEAILTVDIIVVLDNCFFYMYVVQGDNSPGKPDLPAQRQAE